ncbi:beta-ketoacyl-[acyl-carrier-protein] synthase family protein [Amycolatopsis sp. H20-H5]|uniref:beta-ketoacyl-[acyl-carrier-protein] synthase family protein n=1 Tax=Amycolatopsis sp. H20-H5 TaxID=3046309 RepID=UPI002DB58036|nr:beta-ketoacyl-[acyl-carrier-protein] synthase family protein [Amycolatopsis sp. H20-H5]MEC3974251.1 beta-ketoacyl-[acyl-carrier-protein] synthase family protein [Amycolatopsis sp. H20-H5]
MTGRRVAVTGVGVVAPGGIGAKEFWSLLADGRTATRRLTRFEPSSFRSQIAAECDFDAVEHGLTARELRRMDLYVQYALVAAREAVDNSGLDWAAIDLNRVGTSMGTAVGGTVLLEDEYLPASDNATRWSADQRFLRPFMYDALVPSSLAAEIAAAFRAGGPAAVVSTGCTSGLDAIGHACAVIADGEADVMLAGAAESPISPISVACFDAIKATSPNNAEPATASRPFDRRRDGFVLGEGAATLVLEEYESARRRGAHIYCEVSGFASTGNAHHMTGLTAEGIEMSEAIDRAMRQARLNPDDIDYINAHGSGTKQNDRHETAAFKRSLGESAYRTPVSSIKSMVGHSLGAIGSIEAAACVLAFANDAVPPTANLHEPDPLCDLDYVPLEARTAHLDHVLTVGSGFGGFQSALVLSRELVNR